MIAIARRRRDIVVVLAAALAVSCSGGSGCAGCGFQPIPGGFPTAKRTTNAGQLRISQSGLAAVTSDPSALVASFTGSSALSFNVPADCAGSPSVCCTGGSAVDPCGPIDIDLSQHTGDSPRLELHPVQGGGELDVVVRARVKSEMDIPFKEGISCGIAVDTAPGATPDIEIDAPITFVQDAAAGTTRLVVGTPTIKDLTTDDLQLTGGFECTVANFGLSFFLGTLESTLASQLQSTIQDQTCKACASGDVAECGSPFATACTNGVCEEGSNGCLQELGLDGRLPASALFSGFSPGTTGALDLYEVAGGYATSNGSGLALGLLGGMEPGGSARDQCGPPADEPAPTTIPLSSYFQGNTDPDTGSAFGVAIGIHQSQLTQLGFAGYNGGLFCLTVGHEQVSQLSTDTISLLARSLKNLVETSSPVAVGLRPQSAPALVLGPNTYNSDGTLAQPLIDLKMTALEIDFFVAIDDQYVRAFTVVSDVDLPIGLEVTGTGQLQPVIGDVTNAFTNITVKNTQAVTESPDSLAALFPTLLQLVVPQLSSALGPLSLPSVGGLDLSVTRVSAVDNMTFLAIYANLVPHVMALAVHTQAEVAALHDVDDAARTHPATWRGQAPPSATLALGGQGATDLEWQWKSDGGMWTPWTRDAHPTIRNPTYWLPGVHTLQVRARRIGHPETLDPVGVTLELPFGDAATPVSHATPFHGTSSAAGCACDSGGGGAGAIQAAPFALVLLALVTRGRRRHRARQARGRSRGRSGLARLGAVTWLAAAVALPGCSCGSDASNPCGDTPCMDGGVEHGALGRFTSIAADDTRVVAATYDQTLGDLVAVDATDPANLVYAVADGAPAGVAPTFDPSGYRGGVADPGPNVGAWTSVAIAGGTARIAYQDRDAGALKYAFETAAGSGSAAATWDSYVVDGGDGLQVGAYASLAIDASGHPAIAYVAIGVDDGSGHRDTELRLARAANATPAMGDWTTTPVADAPGTCAGLCGAGQSCVAGSAATDPQSCVTPTTDCTTACSDTQACVAGACVAAIPDPTVEEPPGGTGEYVSLVLLPDGRLAAAYYDQTRRALILGVETAPGSSQLTETVLDGDVAGRDVGMWASAAVGADGTVHVAYQDALADELLYTTWTTAGPGTPAVVDDGERAGDRPHPVGAAASIYLASGAPAIAYQDGMLADVMLATGGGGGGGTWSTSGLATGPLLDGFSIGAAVFHGAPVYAWGSLDPSSSPPGALVVRQP